MHVKRDYSVSFLAPRRRRGRWRLIFLVGVLAVGTVWFVSANIESLQESTMDMLGMAPTATPLPSQLATDAVALFLAGRPEESAAVFEDVLSQRPDDVSYIYEYGKVLIELGEYDRALELAEHAIDVSLTDPRGHALKASVLVFTSNPSAAVPVALAGLEYDPNFGPLHGALARAYVGTGQYLDAVNSGELAVQLAPYDSDVRRAYAYALAWTGDFDAAINQLEQAVALEPNSIPAHFALADQYLARDRDQDAIDTYDRILAMQPRNARAMLSLCRAYRKVGQFQRAQAYCQDATSADPTYTEAHYELGRFQYNNYDYTAARDSFEACLANDPGGLLLECTYRKGLALYYLGDCDQAWTLLRDSLTLAGERAGVESAVETITTGLIAISDTCPGYGDAIGSIPPTPQPTAEGNP